MSTADVSDLFFLKRRFMIGNKLTKCLHRPADHKILPISSQKRSQAQSKYHCKSTILTKQSSIQTNNLKKHVLLQKHNTDKTNVAANEQYWQNMSKIITCVLKIICDLGREKGVFVGNGLINIFHKLIPQENQAKISKLL